MQLLQQTPKLLHCVLCPSFSLADDQYAGPDVVLPWLETMTLVMPMGEGRLIAGLHTYNAVWRLAVSAEDECKTTACGLAVSVVTSYFPHYFIQHPYIVNVDYVPKSSNRGPPPAEAIWTMFSQSSLTIQSLKPGPRLISFIPSDFSGIHPLSGLAERFEDYHDECFGPGEGILPPGESMTGITENYQATTGELAHEGCRPCP
ncbi:hypothetical protein K438DRAFT_1968775 [Mycena galopus ATCC 62051]|nr:hypothetical protein K438DRAFT_1968775 [Mycena galopus ATCC 62051]